MPCMVKTIKNTLRSVFQIHTQRFTSLHTVWETKTSIPLHRWHKKEGKINCFDICTSFWKIQFLICKFIGFIEFHKLLTEYYFCWGSDQSFQSYNKHLIWAGSHGDFYILIIFWDNFLLITFFMPQVRADITNIW